MWWFLEFAIKDNRIDYITDINLPNIGDIVIFDYLFCNKGHDHIGIIIDVQDNYIICAEGNISGTNQSGIIKRIIDKHIRGYIRIPDGYKY